LSPTIQQRPIPTSGEMLPVIGLGTWQTFDADGEDQKKPLLKVLTTLVDNGGKVVDTSPMYGRSEQVVGALSEEGRINGKLFLATKVWTSGKANGIRQMNESLRLLRRRSIELMQIHNLTDWETHLPTLREWKEKGTIKYIGITHYTEGAYPLLEKIMTEHPVDFLQVNYSLISRKAEERLFPIAREKKIAVIINRPFEEGALFRKFKGVSLPPWAPELGCETWGQIFLKFILSQPAVTCIIPGTSKVPHLEDNLKAGTGAQMDKSMWKKLISLSNS
jgi:aryl-alcohol dehydrogenase-like predicted oxidoreductase